MAEFLSPGVYVLEESSGAKPISGVSTSTGAFVGISERGPVNDAQFISSFSQFQDVFGGFIADGVLPFAVYQFFKEGGARCFVTRITDGTAVKAVTDKTLGGVTVSIRAKSEGSWANNFYIDIDTGNVQGTVKIKVKKFIRKMDNEDIYSELEVFDAVTLDTVEEIINERSTYIDFDIKTADANAALGVSADSIRLGETTQGTDGLDGITSASFIGTEDKQNGLHSFDTIDEINIVAIPDAAFTDDESLLTSVSTSGMNYCKKRGDCFYIADAPSGKNPFEMKEYKQSLFSDFGALYYPWVIMPHPVTGKSLLLPPSGAIAGLYANTDITVGVHKAPAGQATAVMKSANGLERNVTKAEHDLLNPVGVNAVRFFRDSGIVVWGSRTATSDPEWKYVNVRRLFLYVEESIDEGTQWVVFEPNSSALWGQVHSIITNFLTTVWNSGALFGNTPEEAFYVKVDEENNPEAERNAGRLNIEVGIAPVKPAEFVVIRISQKVAAA